MEKKKNAPKIIAIVLIVLLMLGAGAYWAFNHFAGGSSGEGVYVMPVEEGNGMNAGTTDVFMGVVEAQNTVKVDVDSNKTIRETKVSLGDVVNAGDVLFSYDTDAIQLEIDQLNLDIQQLNSQIASNNTEISDLQQQKAAAGADQQLEYSLNIQALQNTNSSLQYQIKAKQNELASKKKALENTDVRAEVSGTITSVPGASSDYGESSNYFTITESGEYLIKCTVSELNLQQINPGDTVAIKSRVDAKTWSGTIKNIDNSQPATDNNSGYYYDGGGEKASKYYFYVSPAKSDDLFIGRHVIISLGETARSDNGKVHLSEFYIAGLDTDSPYVWKEENGKIVKQAVKLGEYNDETFEYEILEGLESTDYIAYPDETLTEGMKTNKAYDY